MIYKPLTQTVCIGLSVAPSFEFIPIAHSPYSSIKFGIFYKKRRITIFHWLDYNEGLKKH
jgi:hypothetical protein